MKLLTEEKASAALTAVTLTVTLSFAALAVDLGLLVLSRQTLVNAVDAAALAGARELPEAPQLADQIAREYAHLNGAEDVEVEVSPDCRSISVSARRPVRYFFAPVMGHPGAAVGAEATAVVGGITGVRGAVPLAVPRQDYQRGNKYLLKLATTQESPLGPGTFSALSIGGSGRVSMRKT
ncbi:MAG: pilus assembly protein TadG-related protein [Moorellales bacterium]